MIDPALKLLLVLAVVVSAFVGPWSPPTPLGAQGGDQRTGRQGEQGTGRQGEQGTGRQGEQGTGQRGEQGAAQQGEQSATTQSQEEQDPQERFKIAERERLRGEGQRVRVGRTELIFTDIVEFTDTVNDLFIWAWLPTVAGTIDDNAFLGGQTVVLSSDGTIGGDLFIFAQTGRIEGEVGGDLYSFVADLSIAENARVVGAIYGSSGAIRIDGTVEGPVSFAAGGVVINGTILGDVRLEAGKLEIGSNARIEGELRYESANEAEVHPDAQLLGEVRHFIPATPEEEEGGQEESLASASWFSVWSVAWALWWLVGSFVVGALLLAIGGDAARRPTDCLTEQPALGLGFGFVIAVVIPAAVLISLILLVTIPVGVLGFFGYLIAVYIARLVAAQTVGHWFIRGLPRLIAVLPAAWLRRWAEGRSGAEPSAYLSLAVGLVLFYFLTKIPFLGFIFWLLAVCAGLGGIYLATRRRPVEPASPSVSLPTATA